MEKTTIPLALIREDREILETLATYLCLSRSEVLRLALRFYAKKAPQKTLRREAAKKRVRRQSRAPYPPSQVEEAV